MDNSFKQSTDKIKMLHNLKNKLQHKQGKPILEFDIHYSLTTKDKYKYCSTLN